MSPFLAFGSEDGASGYGSQRSGLHATTPRQLASIKSATSFRGSNFATGGGN